MRILALVFMATLTITISAHAQAQNTDIKTDIMRENRMQQRQILTDAEKEQIRIQRKQRIENAMNKKSSTGSPAYNEQTLLKAMQIMSPAQKDALIELGRTQWNALSADEKKEWIIKQRAHWDATPKELRDRRLQQLDALPEDTLQKLQRSFPDIYRELQNARQAD